MTLRSRTGSLFGRCFPAGAGVAGWLALALVTPVLARAESKAPRSIGTHAGGVGSVHFSPDGKLLASAGGDRVVRVWDLATGKQRHELRASSSFTCVVRISPDGKTLASGGYENGGTGAHPIYRWDLATGKALPKLAGHPSGVRRMLYTADSKRLISGGFDGSVKVWDLATGKAVRSFPTHTGAVYTLGLSPDGQALATGGSDGLRLWDLNTGKEMRPALTDSQTLAVAFSPCGKLVASGERDAVRLWELATGKEVQALTGYKGELSFLIFSADGRRLYSSSYDRMVRVWEVRTGKLVREMDGHASWVWGIALAPDEKTLASCGYDTKLLCWDLSGVSRPAVKAVKLSTKELEGYWGDLGEQDAGKAYKAVWALAADPERSLPLLKKRLAAKKAAGALTPGQIGRLIGELDSDEFEVREKASEDLEKAGRQAEPALRRAMPRAPSLEAKRRMERLLAGLRPSSLSAEELTVIRGVQVLEYIGTPEARKVLKALSQGANGVRLSEEATQAVTRLARASKGKR
jgi:WD40 repeat protein